MRYAHRGGYTPAEQERREQVRLQAAERFARGDSVTLIARELRITTRSVRRWRARWQQGGEQALRSAGLVCRERLSAQSWAKLESELKRGPLAHGFVDDQYWTLGRIKTVIGRMFHIGYTVQGVAKLLKRHGWSAPVPLRRALERDEEVIGVWKDEVWPASKTTAVDLGAWICFADETGQGLRPPKARTWAPRGARPVVQVRGRSAGRVNVAGVVCFRPGERAHLFYALHIYRGRTGEAKTFRWWQYRDLIVSTHHQLGGAPLVWCWDNLNVHLARELADFAAANSAWLRVVQLPTYAPELNPAEGVWSLLKRAIANFVAADLDGLVRIIKRKLKKIQYRPHLLDGCLAATGLVIEPW